MDNYLIIIEKQKNNYSAYCPDVDGCIAAGATPDEARKNFLEALEFHFEGLKEDGLFLCRLHHLLSHLMIAPAY